MTIQQAIIATTDPQMRPLRVFVCDDEPLAVEYLRAMLGDQDNVAFVGSLGSAHHASRAIIASDADIVFLDIEMPDGGGFAVVEQLANAAMTDPPLIVFVTAYSRFAARAFDADALDFLTKPVSGARLRSTLSRARSALAAREAGRRLVELEAMVSQVAVQTATREKHIWIPHRSGCIRVCLELVERIEAEGPYVRIHLDATSYLYRRGIGEMAEQLENCGFLRVHRSHLVKRDGIGEIRSGAAGGCEVVLKSGSRVPVGRKFAARVRSASNLQRPRSFDLSATESAGWWPSST